MKQINNNKIKIVFGAASLVLLAACGSAPKQMNPTPAGVSYSYSDGDDLSKVTDKAMKYCSTQGKVAKLQNVGKNDGTPVAIYDCV